MKKIKRTNPEIINIDNLNFTIVDVVFTFNFDNKDIDELNILTSLLSAGTKKYFKEKLIHEEKKRLISCDVFCQSWLDHKNLVFELKMPKEGLIQFDQNKALDLFKDYIYSPKIINNKFDEDEFERIKQVEINNRKNSMRGFNNNVRNEYYKFIDPNEEKFLSPESRIKKINKIKNEELVSLYKKIVNNNYLLIITKERKQDIDKILKHFPNNQKIEYVIPEIDLFDKLNYKEKTIKSIYDESALIMVYQITNFKEEYKKYRPIFLELLYSSETNLLFTNLRTKNGLIYYNIPFNSSLNGLYGLACFLNKGNIDKAIDITNKTVDSLKNMSNLKELVNKRIKGLKRDKLYDEDKIYYKLDKELYSLNGYDSIEERLKVYENIDFGELLDFINNIKLKGILKIVGDKNA